MVIQEALVDKSIVAGEFVDRDEHTAIFAVWQLSIDETIARIEREWLALGREPNLGEIAWFVDPHLLPVTAFIGRDSLNESLRPRE